MGRRDGQALQQRVLARQGAGVVAGLCWYPGLAGRLISVNGGTGALITVGLSSS
jgi:hypothetical protein